MGSNHTYTIASAYTDILSGAYPWLPLGNFMNDWFQDYRLERDRLIQEPILLPPKPTLWQLRWAAFCIASTEYFASRYEVAIPSWVHHLAFSLKDPWFYSEGAISTERRRVLQLESPMAFQKRNIFCDQRIFANKWENDQETRVMAAETKYQQQIAAQVLAKEDRAWAIKQIEEVITESLDLFTSLHKVTLIHRYQGIEQTILVTHSLLSESWSLYKLNKPRQKQVIS